MRSTLHLVHRDDLPWLHALTSPRQATANERRLRQEGVSPADGDRAMALLTAALDAGGPRSRTELAAGLSEAGIATGGQAMPHLMLRAAREGIAVMTLDGRRPVFISARDLLGDPAAVDPDAARAELARRYLAAHGPATDRDLARWAGLPLRDARAGLAAMAGELREEDDGLLDLARRDADVPPTGVRLLPAYDEYLLGWRDRGFALTPEHGNRVQSGGIVRATVTVEGAVAGLWRLDRRARTVDVEPFAAPAPDVAAEVADIARFEGVGLA